MQRTVRAGVSRRRLLGLVATTTLAGCLDDGTSGDATPTDENGATPTDTVTEAPPTSGGDGSGATSPAGSCASAFGDTDERYSPDDRGLIASFAFPMGGTVYLTESNPGVITTAIGYGQLDTGEYRHRVRVFQRGPVEDYDVVSSYTSGGDWEDGGTVTYDGEERPVAVREDDHSCSWVFGAPGPDGTYELEARVGVNIDEPCSDAYPGVCERVSRSFEPIEN